MLWETRELPSRVYGWFAFTTANVVCDIPYAIVFSVIYFVTWYFPVGFPSEASVSGFVFFIILVYFVLPPLIWLTSVIYSILGTMDCGVFFKLYCCRQRYSILPHHGSSNYWRVNSLWYISLRAF